MNKQVKLSDIKGLSFIGGQITSRIEADEKKNEKGHDYWLKTGFIDKVKSSIVNYKDVDTAIAYEENPIRILIKISNEIPEFSKKMNELLEVSGNANGKK